MDVVCVKWGDKFSHEHVNRLYRMVCKNFHDSFRFICYTENAEGIDKEIHIRSLPHENLETWWWKLTLFQEVKGPTLFLDLDVVIQHDITHFKEYIKKNRLCLVKAYWKPYVYIRENDFDVDINSSVMLWEGDLTHVWKDFIKDIDRHLFRYVGIDRYLYYDKESFLDYIPEGECYSRRYGIDHANFNLFGIEDKFYYDDEKSICIFDGWTQLFGNEAYVGYEKYWN